MSLRLMPLEGKCLLIVVALVVVGFVSYRLYLGYCWLLVTLLTFRVAKGSVL